MRAWLTNWLLQRASDLLPASRRPWAGAMHNELAFVDESQRLEWAMGCLWASGVERLRSPEISPGRLVVALLLVLLVGSEVFATALTAAYRLGALDWAEVLGGFTVGDDYRRLIPLMEAVPWWLHGLSLISSACYAFAIVRLVLGLRAAYVPVVMGLAMETMASQLVRPVIEAVGVAANPNPSVVAMILPVLFPLLLAGILWRWEQRPSALKR